MGDKGSASSASTEAYVAEIWGHAFGVETLDRDADFFELGGSSLLAADISAKLRSELNLDITLGSFFEHPTIVDFARAIETESKSP